MPASLLASLLALAALPQHLGGAAIEHLTREEGLPSQVVYFAFQDSRGFVWIGTNFGLVRSDGYRLRPFYWRSGRDPANIGSFYVMAIAEDAGHFLWLGTEEGLVRFDPRTESFTHHRHDPRRADSLSHDLAISLLADSRRLDTLWVGTANGMNRFDRTTNRCRRYLAGHTVRQIRQDAAGRVWALTRRALHRYDPETDAFMAVREAPTGDGDFLDMLVSPQNPDQVWISSSPSGLQFFDSSRSQSSPVSEAPPGRIFCIASMPGSLPQLLLGGDHGACVFDPANRTVTTLELHSRGVGTPRINRIDVDRSNTVWLSSQLHGLFKIPVKAHLPAFRFKELPPLQPGIDQARAILEPSAGHLLIATRAGFLLRYKSREDRFEALPLPGTLDAAVNAMHLGRDGRLWIGTTSDGLASFAPGDREWRRFHFAAGAGGHAEADAIASIAEDGAGRIWAASDFGLHHIDPRSGAVRSYFHDPARTNSLSDSHINPVRIDFGGRLLVGTRAGLDLYQPETDDFRRLGPSPGAPGGLPHPMVMVLHQDARGTIWVGTAGGLARLDQSGGAERFIAHVAVESPSQNFIMGIVSDDAGFLWLNSLAGLVRFDPETATFILYDSRDGVPIYEPVYNAVCRSAAGEICFGGTGGFLRFDPAGLALHPGAPPVAITDLRVADASLPIGGKSPLAHPVTYMEEVRFPYRVNSFAIDCAVLDFRRPEKNQFSFRLEGRDEGWTHLGVQPRISLIDLAPGRYVLRVHGAGCDGRWNEAGASLAIVISPPFWRTWAFGLLIAALLLLLAAYVAWNQRRIRRLKRAGIPADLDRILEKYKVSKREAEVLRLVLAGKSNREIEEDLYISLATVKIHIYNVYRKMKVKSRIQLLHRIQEEASRRS